MKYTLVIYVILLAVCACNNSSTDASKVEKDIKSSALFTRMPSSTTNVNFVNSITESADKNYYNFIYIYNGAGVATADFDNDGLTDLFFAGNEAGNRFYKNKGDFVFEDLTGKAGVKGDGWHTGVSVVDINCDGWLDVFVCRAGWKNDMDMQNRLYINNKDLTFTEQAAEYGFTENDFSIQAAWFDYDKDGDLDVYVTNYPIEHGLPLQERLKKRKNPDENVRDKLYRNNGDNTFTEVAKQAGIANHAHGLGVVATDFNGDGFSDVYVSNDFNEQDFLYINNGDGTFTDRIKDFTGHTSFFGMGIDVADINNDGLEDIFQTEMLPKDYKRSKTNMASMNVKKFEGLINLGVHYQYMHNALQLNRGVDRFSEISQLAGVAKTDWSWACLLSDFDNDGWRDIFVANGYKRDVYDKDFSQKIVKESTEKKRNLNWDEKFRLMPSVKLANFIYQNNGDLTFSDKSKEWGLNELTWSQGAAIADFDNDGDLDLAISNLDQEAMIYRNNAEALGNGFVKIKLNGPKNNPFGIGAEVKIKSGDMEQVHLFKTTRGYLSSVEPTVRFGVGKTTSIDEVVVKWPDGKQSRMTDVPAGQTVTVAYSDAIAARGEAAQKQSLFKDVTEEVLDKVYLHREFKFDDYQKQILLPHKMSQLGPFISTGDVNGDGLEDFFIGGSQGFAGQLYLQTANGQFKSKKVKAFEEDLRHEDMGSAMFDADGDGDLDLYIVSGGVEHLPKANDYYQDRLYLNNGKGQFVKSNKLPQILASGSCVKPFDFDKDGDLDLFVGGRVFPDHYPHSTQSYLLKKRKWTICGRGSPSGSWFGVDWSGDRRRMGRPQPRWLGRLGHSG